MPSVARIDNDTLVLWLTVEDFREERSLLVHTLALSLDLIRHREGIIVSFDWRGQTHLVDAAADVCLD